MADEERKEAEVYGHTVYYEKDAEEGLDHLWYCLTSNGIEELLSLAKESSEGEKFRHGSRKYRLKRNDGGGYMLKRRDD